MIAVAGSETIVFFTHKGAPLGTVNFAGCTAMKFSDDEATLFAGNAAGVAAAISTVDGGIKNRVQYDSSVAAIVSASGGGIVLTETGTLAKPDGVIARLGHHASVVSNAIGSDVFAAASRAGDVSIFTPDGVVRRFVIPGAVVSAMAVSADGGMLAVGGWSGMVWVFAII